jgi:biotin carboxyl carrier protein
MGRAGSRAGRRPVAAMTEAEVRPAGSRAVRVVVEGAETLLVEPPDPGSPGGGVTIDGTAVEAELTDLGGPRRRVQVGADAPRDVLISGRSVSPRSTAARTAERLWEVVVDGWRFEVATEPDAHARLRERATRAGARGSADARVELRAIIPGRIVSIAVATGDSVEAGQSVLIVEAMKMQNELRAPRAGRIGRVDVAPDQNVERGDLLVVIE